MADVAVAQRSNANIGDAIPAALELAQYDKILNLRDDVLAGRHPRLKADPQALSKLTAISGLNGAIPGLSPKILIGKACVDVSKEKAIETTPRTSLSNKSAVPVLPTNVSQKPTRNTSVAYTSSSRPSERANISNPLDIKQERTRIERLLEDQVQLQQRGGFKKKESEQDALADFDVSEVFEKALELVKPLAVTDIVGAGANGSAGSESVDDNTFYSSQVNDSDADENDLNPKTRGLKPCKYYFQGKCNRGNSCNFSHDPAFREKLQQEQLTGDTDMPDAYDRSQKPQQRPASLDPHARRGSPDYGREEGELVEESSYSPPNVQEPPEGIRPRRNRQSGGRNGRQHDMYFPHDTGSAGRRRSGRASPIYDNQAPPPGGRRFSGRNSPVYDGQVVRNHITSPVAPQPARVSPLAVAKVQNLGRAANVQEDRSKKAQRQLPSNHNSPNSAQAIKSKKRRRDQDKADNNRNVAPRRYIDSPGPHIKEEPMSPPPVAAMAAPPAYQNREVILRSPPLQYVSPQGERVVYRQARDPIYVDEQPRFERVSSPSARRAVSGPSGRYEIEPDLRRVVSARNLGMAASPQHETTYHTPPSVPGPARSTSRAYVIEQSPESRQMYRASVQPQPIQYARPQRGSPEGYQQNYSPRQQEAVSMAPPPRRIVVGEDGRRYYETPIIREPMMERIGSAVPQPRPRYIEDVETRPMSSRASVRPEMMPRYPLATRYVEPPSLDPASPHYADSAGRYDASPRYMEQFAQPPPPPRAVSRAPSRAPGPLHVEAHQDGFARAGHPRIIEVPRERSYYADGMPPPPPQQVRLHSAAPPSSYQQSIPLDEYEGDGGERRYQRVERGRVSTAQPDVARYTYDGASEAPKYVEVVGGRYQGMIPQGREPFRAGSVFEEGSRGRRIEYVERVPGGY